jgi:hypothetical protein
MLVADRVAQRAEAAVVGDERGGGGIGAFEHAGVAEVGELPGSAVDIRDEGAQGAGQFVLGALGEECGELSEFAAGVDRGEQAGG